MFSKEDDEAGIKARKSTIELPRNLESLSVEELREYITVLQAEIARVEDDIARKQAANAAADAFFK